MARTALVRSGGGASGSGLGVYLRYLCCLAIDALTFARVLRNLLGEVECLHRELDGTSALALALGVECRSNVSVKRAFELGQAVEEFCRRNVFSSGDEGGAVERLDQRGEVDSLIRGRRV